MGTIIKIELPNTEECAGLQELREVFWKKVAKPFHKAIKRLFGGKFDFDSLFCFYDVDTLNDFSVSSVGCKNMVADGFWRHIETDAGGGSDGYFHFYLNGRAELSYTDGHVLKGSWEDVMKALIILVQEEAKKIQSAVSALKKLQQAAKVLAKIN